MSTALRVSSRWPLAITHDWRFAANGSRPPLVAFARVAARLSSTRVSRSLDRGFVALSRAAVECGVALTSSALSTAPRASSRWPLAELLFGADPSWTATAGFGVDYTKKFSHLFVRGGRSGVDPCPGKVLAANFLRIRKFDNGEQPRYTDRLLRAFGVFMNLPFSPGYHDPPDAVGDGTTAPVKASDVAAAHAVVLCHRQREADPPWRSSFCHGARVLLEYLCRHAELRSGASAVGFQFRPFTALKARVVPFHQNLVRSQRDYRRAELTRLYERTGVCLSALNAAAHGGRTAGVAAPRPPGVPEPDHESAVGMVRRSSRRARLLRIAPTRFVSDTSNTTTPLHHAPPRRPPPCHPPTP